MQCFLVHIRSVFNRRFPLTFSAVLGNSSKLDCAHLHDISGDIWTIFILIHPLLFCQLSSATRTIPYAIFFPRKPFNLSAFAISICLWVVYRWTVGRANHSSLKGWARRGFIHRLYFTRLSALLFRFFKGHFYFPTIAGKAHHNCGAASPQLWGRYTTVVGQ